MAGILISPAARGRGLGAALVNAVLDVAFEELQLHRVGLGVFRHNATAIGLYEGLGFPELHPADRRQGDLRRSRGS